MHRRRFAQLAAASLASGAIPPFARRTLAITRTPAPSPRINATRLNAHLTAISEFGKNPQGGVSRMAYTPADLAARAYAKGLMRDAGLTVRVDEAGNIFGRRAGSDANAKPLVFGSHIDSVPEGGNYDGNLGSLGAIEVAQSLAESRIVTRHPIDVVIWQNEEGGIWGSRLVTTSVADTELATIAISGTSIRDGIAMIGGNPAQIAQARLTAGSVHAYLELHIEQGGVLDKAGLQIGVVEGIVNYREWDVTVTGVANHAGTTVMPDRHDAMLAAARFTEMVNRVVTREAGRQVGTVGRIRAFPGAPNVVPGRVECTLELRDLDDAKVQRLYEAVAAESAAIGAMNGTAFAFREFAGAKSAKADPRIRALIQSSAASLGFTSASLPSGAGHDAQNMARVCPMGMIFIPSVGGISHAPNEYSTPEACGRGAEVLAAAVLAVDAAALE